MEDKVTNQPTAPQTPVSGVSAHKSKKLLVIVLVVLLLVGATGGVYFWQQKKVKDGNKRADELSAQLRKVSAEKTTQQSTPAPSPQNQNATVVYTATVGKFTLTLPEKYVVIQHNDGGGEGGPSTHISVGDKTSTPGIVNSSDFKTITLTARSLSGGSFREYVDGSLKNKSPQKQPSIQIGGVSAEVYLVGGLAAPKEIYFTKNNLLYSITMADTNNETTQKLKAIIDGFKFN